MNGKTLGKRDCAMVHFQIEGKLAFILRKSALEIQLISQGLQTPISDNSGN